MTYSAFALVKLVVRGRIELPTFRFSGGADAQLSPITLQGLAVRGCASLALAAHVAVAVAVKGLLRRRFTSNSHATVSFKIIPCMSRKDPEGLFDLCITSLPRTAPSQVLLAMIIGSSRLPGHPRGTLGPGPEARPSSSWCLRPYEADCCRYQRRLVRRTLRIQACPHADVASIAEPEAARWAGRSGSGLAGFVLGSQRRWNGEDYDRPMGWPLA
jgi:hypothetical protein